MTLRNFVGLAALLIAGFAPSVHAQDAAPEPRLTKVSTTSESAAVVDIADDMSVALDFARLMRVPTETTTLVLGNPSIADATIQKNGLIVVTGKSYGTTNLVALDSSGQLLHETQIHVTAPKKRTLTVLRGTSRETWSCAPRCEQTITLGDSAEYFGASSGQATSRNGFATQRQ